MLPDLRILLWDIDGTLVRSRRAGAFKEYTIPVLESVFGTAGRLGELSVSGMTDLQIVAESLRDEGFTHEEIRARLRELSRLYLAALEQAAGASDPPLFEMLPGVREALAAADAHPRYLSALLTGNIEPAARLKLRLVGLADFFTLPGAFGNDSHDRRDLPAGEARSLLSEILDTVDAERRGRARATLGDEIAASLACRAAVKTNTPLTTEKMRWLIDRLLLTSSPTTCPHGRPVILRLARRDIERAFHKS